MIKLLPGIADLRVVSIRRQEISVKRNLIETNNKVTYCPQEYFLSYKFRSCVTKEGSVVHWSAKPSFQQIGWAIQYDANRDTVLYCACALSR